MIRLTSGTYGVFAGTWPEPCLSGSHSWLPWSVAEHVFLFTASTSTRGPRPSRFRMPLPIFPADAGRLQLPTKGCTTVSVVSAFCLARICVLPFYQVWEARRQAHQELRHLLAADNKLDAEVVIAAFDRSNQNLDAAASGPCLILAVTSILLVNRTLRLRRRCHALMQELSSDGAPKNNPVSRSS